MPQNYQLRIAYATYKLVQAMPGGEHHVGFTRILHRTKPDALMGEIETFRADPLQPKCDDWCGAVLRLRAWKGAGIHACPKGPSRTFGDCPPPPQPLPAALPCRDCVAPPCCGPAVTPPRMSVSLAGCRCEYPVSDRGNAVRLFFDAAEKEPSMIKVSGGAGVCGTLLGCGDGSWGRSTACGLGD